MFKDNLISLKSNSLYSINKAGWSPQFVNKRPGGRMLSVLVLLSVSGLVEDIVPRKKDESCTRMP